MKIFGAGAARGSHFPRGRGGAGRASLVTRLFDDTAVQVEKKLKEEIKQDLEGQEVKAVHLTSQSCKASILMMRYLELCPYQTQAYMSDYLISTSTVSIQLSSGDFFLQTNHSIKVKL